MSRINCTSCECGLAIHVGLQQIFSLLLYRACSSNFVIRKSPITFIHSFRFRGLIKPKSLDSYSVGSNALRNIITFVATISK